MSTEGKTITCKAAVVYEYNSEIKIETIKVGPPPPDHVRLKMVATALCHSDLSILEGYVPIQLKPYIPGHEGAGIVESVGEGVTRLKKGDKVLTLCIPRCGICPICISGKSNYCLDVKRKNKLLSPLVRTENIDGSKSYSLASTGDVLHQSFGTSSFSEYTVIPENSAIKIHDDAPMEKVCTMACGFPTGFGASANAVNIKSGDKVAVWGMGGVGLACVMGCKDKNSGKIIGIDVTHEKEEIARKTGCTDYIALNDLEPGTVVQAVKKLTPLGVDFAFACVGNAAAMEDAYNCVGPGGTLVVVGVTKGTDIIKIPPLTLLPSKKIVGTLIGDYNIHEGIPKLVERYVNGELLSIDDLSTKTTSLEHINEAFSDMKGGHGVRTIIIF